jgi:hypothetical protein
MNYGRVVLAAVGGMVMFFILGALIQATPLAKMYGAYPGVYREKEAIMSRMPIGMSGMFVAILVVTLIYAMSYSGGSGVAAGARLGLLVGIFAACAFEAHSFTILNIGGKLALGLAAAAIVQWTVIAIAIGLIYKPLPN